MYNVTTGAQFARRGGQREQQRSITLVDVVEEKVKK